MEISTSYTAASLSVTGTVSETVSSGKSAREGRGGDRVELSDQSRELAFSLDLQYEEFSLAAESAEVTAGPDGVSVSYTGIAAEAFSMSASFTMTTSGESGPSGGNGSHLNDEVSKVGKEVKPLVKEFIAAAGVKGGWGQVNRFLRAVV